MKDRKSLLYIMAGFLAFAWWEAWQQDHGKGGSSVAPKDSATVTTTQSTQQPQSSGGDVLSGRAVLPHNLPHNHARSAQSLNRAVVPSNSASVASEAPIIVRTELVEAVINPRGGNLESLKLLKYPQKLDSKQTVQLLSNATEGKLYVTGSGFDGRLAANESGDGNDKLQTNGQLDTATLLFTSDSKRYELKPTVGNNNQSNQTMVVTLQARDANGILFSKKYTFQAGSYAIKVQNRIDNYGSSPWNGRFYATLSRQQESEGGAFSAGASSYDGAAISSPERPYHKVTFKDLQSKADRGDYGLGGITDGWIAFQQRYFLSVWIPAPGKTFDYFGYARNNVGHVGLYGMPMEVAAGKHYQTEATLYAGPEIVKQLAPLAKGLDRTVDYGWLWFLSNFFFQVLQGLYNIVGNWGVCIILVTILIKAAFYKLSENSYRSMARMKRLTPKLNALKERYGSDKQALGQATMELYRKEGINPLSMGGCLPMIVQIPFFIAFYYVLSSAIEFRQSPFIWWIKDLSDKDPYYILPVLMGASMWLQQKMSPNTGMDEGQAKAMMLMPVIFTAMFINFPSGLVLYWMINNLLSILQQWYINRKVDTEGVTQKYGAAAKRGGAAVVDAKAADNSAKK